jgi:excinuclease ABC subunit A
VVITGPSGSGKSSLAFDTIYAEGQRRYVESLSAYARQFLGMQDKPDVDDISGLSPSISIEQKGVSHNPRSTVGTVTEIYDYLRLLFGRAGIPYCPECGKELRSYSLDEIVSLILGNYEDQPVEILAPVIKGKKGEFKNLFIQFLKQGFLRAKVDGTLYWLEEDIPLDKNRKHDIEILIDRMTVSSKNRGRLAEAVETALETSSGFVKIEAMDETKTLSEHAACPDCDISFPEIEPRLFSFNNPYGACPDCNGLGSHEYFAPERIVDESLPPLGGALLPWKKKHYMLRKLSALDEFIEANLGENAYKDLSEEVKNIILYGSSQKLVLNFRDKKRGETVEYMGRYEGLIPWLETRWRETESEAVKNELAGYRNEDICKTCGGARLRREALAVKVGGMHIGDVVSMAVEKLKETLETITLSEDKKDLSEPIVAEIIKRLSFMNDVGVGYLSLSRRADTLSAGESQRIRLATQLGSKLTGVLYVLDEPTIGLHARDTSRLLKTLETIRDLENTVLVVEHDRETMMQADHIIELGPGAGEWGGKVIASAPPLKLSEKSTLSGPYLKGSVSGIVRSETRRKPKGFIGIRGASENNLKNLDIDIPLGLFVCITGVSGSGKSTLMHEILYKGLRRKTDKIFRERAGKHKEITGWQEGMNAVMIDQAPIGRTPRSNPATYTGVFTPIRELYSRLPESRMRGYDPGRFSFNVRGGRCEACKGEGEVKISMLFMPDVYVKCDVCKGSRYNQETLDIRFKGKNIAEVLEMTVSEASEFFSDQPGIAGKLRVIAEAGLGYIRLGQPAPTLSGGEAQRVKLATELGKKFRGNTLYLMDEPTTGLHYRDVHKLLILLQKLVDQGNTVVVIEHNLDVIASCDHIIDLGPEGGENGGLLVGAGSLGSILANETSYTGKYLRKYLEEMGMQNEQ